MTPLVSEQLTQLETLLREHQHWQETPLSASALGQQASLSVWTRWSRWSGCSGF
ncbi:hypothetical protein EIO60_01653|nr:hypothetical protein [Candidatus Pantoea persica]